MNVGPSSGAILKWPQGDRHARRNLYFTIGEPIACRERAESSRNTTIRSASHRNNRKFSEEQLKTSRAIRSSKEAR